MEPIPGHSNVTAGGVGGGFGDAERAVMVEWRGVAVDRDGVVGVVGADGGAVAGGGSGVVGAWHRLEVRLNGVWSLNEVLRSRCGILVGGDVGSC